MDPQEIIERYRVVLVNHRLAAMDSFSPSFLLTLHGEIGMKSSRNH